VTEKTVRVRAKNPAPRGKGKWKAPGLSKRMKELWQTPEFREKMRLRNEKVAELRKLDPAKFSRVGVPSGMNRAMAEPLWTRARQLADRFIQIMKDKGELSSEEAVLDDTLDMYVEVPEGDSAKAEAALKEAFVLAIGPTDSKIKIQAINTVLNFTKSKPESRSKLTLNKAEDFLDAIAGDDS
jgi:hypothetical protein